MLCKIIDFFKDINKENNKETWPKSGVKSKLSVKKPEGQCSIYIHPENIRKAEVFCYYGVQK